MKKKVITRQAAIDMYKKYLHQTLSKEQLIEYVTSITINGNPEEGKMTNLGLANLLHFSNLGTYKVIDDSVAGKVLFDEK